MFECALTHWWNELTSKIIIHKYSPNKFLFSFDLLFGVNLIVCYETKWNHEGIITLHTMFSLPLAVQSTPP